MMILFLWVAASSPEEALASARAHCAAAKARAFDLRSGAVTEFDRAVSAYQQALPVLESMREVSRCLVDAGAAWMVLRRADRSLDSFVRALLLTPDFALDEDRDSPSVVAAFARAKAKVNELPMGALTLVGEPRGAEVKLDGRVVGTVPLSLAGIVAGEHWVLVTAAEFSSYATVLTVAAREPTRVDIFLHALHAPAPTGSAPVDAPMVIAPLARPRVNPILGAMPFGVGQWSESRPLPAALFFGSQSLLLATDIAAFEVAYSFRTSAGTFRQAGTVTALAVVANLAFGLFIADILAGSIEGLAHAITH